MKKFDTYLIEKNIRTIKIRIKKKVPMADRQSQVVSRGMDRKHLRQIPIKYSSFFTSITPGSAEGIVNSMKKTKMGIRKISKRELVDIAKKYKFYIPNDKKPTKHLGSTGIMAWRRGPGQYYLIKRGGGGK